MSVRGTANQVIFLLKNSGRETANPPVVFPDVRLVQGFTFSIWCKVRSTVPFVLATYSGTNGSQIIIGSTGTQWYMAARNAAVATSVVYFANVTVDRWAFIGLSKTDQIFMSFYGLQDPFETNPWERPITIEPTAVMEYPYEFDFDYFVVAAGLGNNISSLKFWNYALITSDIQIQAHRWDAQPSGGGQAPMWASTLRTPGDISSIANPYTSPRWGDGHAYTLVYPPNSLVFEQDDPAFMANTMPCPTWVYPITKIGVFPRIFYDLDQTPLITTTYKGVDFWEFEDRGSVSPVPHQFVGLVYYGYPYADNVGVGPSDTWGLYKDNLGAEVSNTSSPDYKFEPTTGVKIPAPIDGSTMYLWKYGAQFTWQAVTPQVEAARGNLAFLMLLATYIGYPTGVPALPAVDLAGLFAIQKGKATDTYNRGVEMKIPDPTIRTAYIGE